MLDILQSHLVQIDLSFSIYRKYSLERQLEIQEEQHLLFLLFQLKLYESPFRSLQHFYGEIFIVTDNFEEFKMREDILN